MELKPGSKQTKMGVIPEDWSSNSLSSLCLPGGLVRGPFGGSLKKEFFVKEGYKVYEQRNAIYQSVEMGSYFIDHNKYTELKRFDVVPGDFIVSCSGTIGRIFQIPKDAKAGVINQALLKIKLNTNFVSSDYFYQAFVWDEFQQKIVDSTQGGAMQNLVGMDVFKNTPLALPPFPEQRAIAAALSDTDSLLSSLGRLLAKKRDIKQSVMQQLLTGKQRLPGFSGEWKIKRLGDISKIGMGRTPSRQMQAFWGKGYPWLSIADLKTKHVSETKEEITRLAASSMTVIPKGTLIMSFKLSIGRMAFTSRDMYSNEAICSFNDLKMNAGFLYYVLGQTDFSLYGKQAVKGFTLNSESLKIIEVPYPSLDEQAAIATVLSDMDAEIDELQQRRDKTRAIKQGMMQELLTGRTRLV